MSKTIFLQTFGCQMNERDSEEVLGMLTAQGYEVSADAQSADVILLNTCSVREHAEERAFGRMGELSSLKKQRPEMVMGIIGCMAKLRQDEIFKRLPAVDLIAGPAELYDLPYLLAEIQQKRQKIAAVGRAFRPLEQKPRGEFHRPGVTAFVTVMEGCDKACTYCIVPKTRGQEISRPAEDIIAEINQLTAAGYQEITLLGQNVNSYGKRFPDGSGFKGPLGRLRLLEEAPETLLDFPQLLRMIDATLASAGSAASRAAQQILPPGTGAKSAIRGFAKPASPRLGGREPARRGEFEFSAPQSDVWRQENSLSRDDRRAGRQGAEANDEARRDLLRVRFTTSHPFDANERLFEAMRDCASVCEWLHLPVQSGSNRILRAMRRGYTREAYLEKVAQLRALIPDISLSTDIIIGFPGETDEDFEHTMSLMRAVGYDNAYIFKYSPRPGTDAAAREDDVPQAVKEARHQALLALQEQIVLKRFERFQGRTVDVLMEGPGKKPGQWFGRTRGNHGVIVEGVEPLAGEMPVRITRAAAHTLFGTLA